MPDQFPDATKMAPTLCDRIALAVCGSVGRQPALCGTACPWCRQASVAVIRELVVQAGSAKHWHVNQLVCLAAELEGSNG